MLNGRLGFPLGVYKNSYFKFLTQTGLFKKEREPGLSETRANNRPRKNY